MPKKKVPAKNIQPILVDVKKPGFHYEHAKRTRLNLARMPRKPIRSKKPRRIFWGIVAAVLVVLFVAADFVIYNVGIAKNDLSAKGRNIIDNFSTSLEALRNLKPGEAVLPLTENNQDFSALNELLNKNQTKDLLNILSNFVPQLKEAGSLVGQAAKLNADFLNLSSVLADLQAHGLKYFESDGQTFMKRLTEMRDLTGNIIGEIEAVRNVTARLKGSSEFLGGIDSVLSQDYLKYSADLYAWNKFLGAALALLSSPTEKHILLLFQNPAEIRPGGGFIGSYADLTLANGQMQKIDVRDIYDPDGQLDLKVIPPEPLQGITHDWGARDANWFFDFPTSARTVIDFMEKSKMCSEHNVTFDAAIALNINVLQSILDLTGPIELPDYKLTVDKDNFLDEIQRDVEAGQDKKAGYPKHILQVLTPLILEKLNGLSETDASRLMANLKDRLAKKDIMFFAKDPDLANLFAATDADGAVYVLPNSFWGNYLAVVNANIAGGKSDAFINQNLAVNVNIDSDGSIFTDLTVQRTHTGDTQKDPWWRAPNKDFIQILANANTSLFSIKGNDAKNMTLGTGYGGYAANPDLAAIEDKEIAIPTYHAWTTDAFGKKVFAAWLTTLAGQTKTLEVHYQVPAPPQLNIDDGTVYRFVFERQSGVANETLNISVGAPLGFVWNESQSPVFTYESSDLPGRLILTLTLKKSS